MQTGISTAQIDLARFRQYVDNGLINCQAHPLHPLFIFNYTPKAQYERAWDEVTLQCRGLITDIEGNVIARPFSKFFNLEELSPEQIPAEAFDVYEKMDGSLGILYWTPLGPRIATRGSFQSEQSQIASHLLHSKYLHTIDRLDPSLTYLFEIIYPQNRIVVNYGEREELVLLAIIDTETGQDLPLVDIGFPVVKQYDGLADITALKALERENAEGFVVKFKSGLRCKVKFAEYVRLHRILTGVSNLAIWEYLSTGKSFDELLTMVPDEFYNWVKFTIADLQSQYNQIEAEHQAAFQELPTRKECAIYYQTHRYPAILFKMLDKQPYEAIIWKAIRPKFCKAFTIDA